MLCPVEFTEQDFVEPPKISHKKKSEKERERDRVEREQAQSVADYFRKKQEEMNKPVNPENHSSEQRTTIGFMSLVQYSLRRSSLAMQRLWSRRKEFHLSLPRDMKSLVKFARKGTRVHV